MPPGSYSHPHWAPGFPQLPYNGPPRKPSHIRVDPQVRQNGSRQINPAYNANWSSASTQANQQQQTLVPGQAWHEPRPSQPREMMDPTPQSQSHQRRNIYAPPTQSRASIDSQLSSRMERLTTQPNAVFPGIEGSHAKHNNRALGRQSSVPVAPLQDEERLRSERHGRGVKTGNIASLRQEQLPRVGARQSNSSEDSMYAPHGPDGTSLGYLKNLLASWERLGCLLSTVVAPEEDRQGLLKAAEAQITMFLALILDSRAARRAAQELEESSAQSFVDAIQNVLDWGTLPDADSRVKARKLMQKVAEAREKLPSSLFIIGVNDHDEHPIFSGGFGDVYQASYEGKRVALKRIRTFTADSTTHRNRLQFYKEALVWQGLRHRFVLPLLGIDRSTFAPSFCMVSPWMKYGTVLRYLQDRGRGGVNRLLLEIAQGLGYLHHLKIIHGDLRGTNILISDDGHACLSDFGLATTLLEAESTAAMTSSSNRAGSTQWLAPELIAPKSFGCERYVRTTASDVYAYACVCVELYTGRPPFDRLSDAAVIHRVIAGDRPQQPPAVSAALWKLVTAAWVPESHARPSIHKIAAALEDGPGTVSASPA